MFESLRLRQLSSTFFSAPASPTNSALPRAHVATRAARESLLLSPHELREHNLASLRRARASLAPVATTSSVPLGDILGELRRSTCGRHLHREQELASGRPGDAGERGKGAPENDLPNLTAMGPDGRPYCYRELPPPPSATASTVGRAGYSLCYPVPSARRRNVDYRLRRVHTTRRRSSSTHAGIVVRRPNTAALPTNKVFMAPPPREMSRRPMRARPTATPDRQCTDSDRRSEGAHANAPVAAALTTLAADARAEAGATVRVARPWRRVLTIARMLPSVSGTATWRRPRQHAARTPVTGHVVFLESDARDLRSAASSMSSTTPNAGLA